MTNSLSSLNFYILLYLGGIFCGGLKIILFLTIFTYNLWSLTLCSIYFARKLWEVCIRAKRLYFYWIINTRSVVTHLTMFITPTLLTDSEPESSFLEWLVKFTSYNDWILNPRLKESRALIFRIIRWNLPSGPFLLYTLSESFVWIWFLD